MKEAKGLGALAEDASSSSSEFSSKVSSGKDSAIKVTSSGMARHLCIAVANLFSKFKILGSLVVGRVKFARAALRARLLYSWRDRRTGL